MSQLTAKPLEIGSFAFPEEKSMKFSQDALTKNLIEDRNQKLQSLEKRISQSLTKEEKAKALSVATQIENRRVLRAFEAYTKTLQKGGISEDQAQKLHALINDHPLVSDKGLAKFDKKNRQVGFCFGRATYLHLELLRNQIPPELMAKAWLVGPLNVQNIIWDFHVALIIKDKDHLNKWWAIDGYGSSPLELKDWIRQVSKWSLNDPNPRTLLYISDPLKFNLLPNPYSTENLTAPYYKGFFESLGEWFSKHPQSARKIF